MFSFVMLIEQFCVWLGLRVSREVVKPIDKYSKVKLVTPKKTSASVTIHPKCRMDKACCPLAEPGTGLKTQQSNFATKEKIKNKLLLN
jgi:hypothetical protein